MYAVVAIGSTDNTLPGRAASDFASALLLTSYLMIRFDSLATETLLFV